MSTKPTVTPSWNTAGTDNVEPSSGRKSTGFVTGGDTPDAEELNWLLKAQSEACAYALEFGVEVNPGGRLTLTSGTPVTTSDVTGATTVYYTPCKGDRIPLYDGTNWSVYTFTETSQLLSDATKSPAAAAANTNYDMFAWMDSSTFRVTRGPAWSTNIAPGTGAGTTEVEIFNGRYVNKYAITNGPAARRGLYVGSIRTDGSTQASDTALKRYVANQYNDERRTLKLLLSGALHSYTTGGVRQWGGVATNQVDVLVARKGTAIVASASATVATTGASGSFGIGIGWSDTATMVSNGGNGNTGAAATLSLNCSYAEELPTGRWFFPLLEYGTAQTTQWLETVGLSGFGANTGIVGSING